MKDKTKKGPLLYIVQPSLQEVKANMQETFIIKKPKALKEHEPKQEVEMVPEETAADSYEFVLEKEEPIAPAAVELESVETRNVEQAADEELGDVEEQAAHEEAGMNEMESSVAELKEVELEEESEEAPAGTVWRSKPFKEMNNEERLHFILHRPHYIPKVKSVVRTEADVYVGFILSFEDSVVTVNAFMKDRMRKVQLPLETIVSVEMYGL